MTQRTHATPKVSSLRINYRRGLRYRQELLATGRPIRCPLCRTVLKDAVRVLGFSRIDRGSRIADALAKEFAVTRKQMSDDGYFAAAVDTIAHYCGDEARTLILSGHKYLGRKTVMSISHTAPTRQQYELEQVKKGRRPLETKGVSDPVFDTVDFKEIISRLARTQGKLGVCLLGLERLSDSVSEKDKIEEQGRLVIERAGLLRRSLAQS